MTEALLIYAQQHGEKVAAPATLGYAIKALAWWGETTVAGVKAPTCDRYARERRNAGVTDSTIRREMGVLNAALRYCYKQGYLTDAPRPVTMPALPAPRDRWLDRSEMARLLWAARRTKHLARFILLAYYTGTRSGALKALQWVPNMEGGHIDLEAGVLHRASMAARRTKKRQPPARLARKITNHLRRWRDDSRQYVIEWRAQPVKSIKRAWRESVERSGIEHATPHDLRRTAITHAMQRGVRLASAANMFGLSVDELERTYFVHHPDFQKDVIDALDRSHGNVPARRESD